MPGMLAAAFHSMKGLTFKSKVKLKKKNEIKVESNAKP